MDMQQKYHECVDRNSNKIDLNEWEILGRLLYKKNVDVLYLRNKYRTPEQEQIFLVGYQSNFNQGIGGFNGNPRGI